MVKGKVITLFVLIFISLSLVLSLEYNVIIDSPGSVNEYEGKIIRDQFSAIITNNGEWCDISCTLATSAGEKSGIKVPEKENDNIRKEFFDVKYTNS